MSKRHKIYVYSAVIPMIIMGIVYVLAAVRFPGKSVFTADFLQQYFSFYQSLGRVLKSLDTNALFYSFEKVLGGQMASVYGFNSISPFTVLYGVLPVDNYNLSAIVVSLLRYAALGLSFSHFLVKRYDALRKPLVITVIFSITYALSGYTLANQVNPNFLDNLVYLPILLITFEELLDGKPSKWFSILIALICVTQFYIAYMIVLFLALYPILYLSRFERTWKDYVVSYKRFVGHLALGIELSAVWLMAVGSALVVSKGTKFGFNWNWLEIGFNPLAIFYKMIPGSINGEEWGQLNNAVPNIYVGSVVVLFILNFLCAKSIAKREKYGFGLMVCILLASFVYNPLFRIWHMGQVPAGFSQRFAFVAIVVLLIVGYRGVADNVAKVNRLLVGYIGLLAVGFFVVKRNLVTPGHLLIPIVLLLLVYLMVHLTRLHHVTKRTVHLVMVGVTVFELGIHSYDATLNVPFFRSHLTQQRYEISSVVKSLTESDGGFYRTYISSLNDGLDYGVKGLTHFSSSVETDMQKFFQKVGVITVPSVIRYVNSTVFLDAFLGVKYYLRYNELPGVSYLADKLKIGNQVIYRQDGAFSVGMLASEDVYRLDMSKAPLTIQNALMSTLALNETPPHFEPVTTQIQLFNLVKGSQAYQLVDDKKESKLTHTFKTEPGYAYYIQLPHQFLKKSKQFKLLRDGKEVAYEKRAQGDLVVPLQTQSHDKSESIVLTQEQVAGQPVDQLVTIHRLKLSDFKAFLEERRPYHLNVTHHTQHSIEGTVHVTDQQNVLVMTIPYQEGWHVTVDDKPVTPVRVLDHLIGIPLTAGQHTVKMSFTVPNLYLGGIISIVALGIWIVVNKRERR